jgi:methyl-accepting chemotaxis protein
MGNWFLNLSTRGKLFLAFAAAALVAVLVGLAGLAGVRDVFSRADQINKISRGALNSVVKIRLTADSVYNVLFEMKVGASESTTWADHEANGKERALLTRKAKELKDQAAIVLGNKAAILAVVGEMAAQGTGTTAGADTADTEGQAKFGEVAGTLSAFDAHMAILIETIGTEEESAPGGPPLKPLMMGKAKEVLADVRQDAQKLEGGLDEIAIAAVDRMGSAAEHVRWLMVGAGLAGVGFAALVGVITTRMIVNPLTEMTSAAHRISEGDLTAEINHVSRDEVGGLADSFRRMQGSLRDLSADAQRVAGGDLTRSPRGGGELGESFTRMVESLSALLREIQEAGTQVRGNSSKILGNLQRNAEASREETVAADRVQESVEQLSASARGIATSATEVERTAGDAARVASQGTASVGAALEGMFKIRERVAEITQKTLVLGEKCRRIGEVLKIIRDVAGEIHMLALNAAIESAASAGEQGKRFAVVAAEVRRLAERTRQSAEEIRAILTEIQEAAEATVEAAQQGAREVEAGSTVATGARSALEDVITRIHKTAEVARDISRSTQDQRQASEAVVASMRDISRAVRRMAEGSEESSKAVRELAEIAERFGDLVGTFRTS